MDVKQMRYFLSVVEAGSFSKAAVVLGVTQPVLSRQIRLLEEGLGTELLYRNGRGVELTESGRLLVRRAKEILRLVNEVQDELGAMNDMPSGNFTIGVPPTVSAILTASLLRRVECELPKVSLKIAEGLSGHVLEWLANGRLDLAVLYDAPIMTTLNVDPLLREELVLVSPPTMPVPLDEDGEFPCRRLAETSLLLPGHPHALRVLVERSLEGISLRADVRYEIDTLATILRCVEEGLASTVLPYAAVERLQRLERVQVTRIVRPTITRALVLATSTQRPVTSTTRRLVQIVKSQVGELVDSGVWAPRGGDVVMGDKVLAEI